VEEKQRSAAVLLIFCGCMVGQMEQVGQVVQGQVQRASSTIEFPPM